MDTPVHHPAGRKFTPALHETGTDYHPEGRRGRGAVSNASSRFDRLRKLLRDNHFAFDDDGWGSADAPPPALKTTVSIDNTRNILAKNDSPDVPFDRSINPYRGCEHGCVYCFARPTHAYLGLSPGLDFESKLFAKPEAARLLAGELRKPGYSCRPIAMGTNTDPYQPLEKSMGITRDLIKVLAAFDHPLTIVTKSALVARDIDLLAPMAEKRLVQVMLSITTLDRSLARKMEPRAATPQKRLDAVSALATAGIPTGVMFAPVIPGLTDHEMESVLEASRDAGASMAGYVLLRLPYEIKDIFQEWLAERVPDRAARVMSHIRAARGGKDNDPHFGSRMVGHGPYAELITSRFRVATHRLGLNQKRIPLDTQLFKAPPAAGDQLTLFG
jgi:DNA repair photolyase